MNAQLPPTYGMWHRSKPQQMPFTLAKLVATQVYNCNIFSRWTTDTISQRQLLKNKKFNPYIVTRCSRFVTKRNQKNMFAMLKTGKHADPYCFLNGGQSFLHGHTLHKHDLLRYWPLLSALQEMLQMLKHIQYLILALSICVTTIHDERSWRLSMPELPWTGPPAFSCAISSKLRWTILSITRATCSAWGQKCPTIACWHRSLTLIWFVSAWLYTCLLFAIVYVKSVAIAVYGLVFAVMVAFYRRQTVWHCRHHYGFCFLTAKVLSGRCNRFSSLIEFIRERH